jgi:hypothetical protein
MCDKKNLQKQFKMNRWSACMQHTRKHWWRKFKTPTFYQFKTSSFYQFKTPTFYQFKTPNFYQFKTPTFYQFKTHTFYQFKTPTFYQFKTPIFYKFKTPTFYQFKLMKLLLFSACTKAICYLYQHVTAPSYAKRYGLLDIFHYFAQIQNHTAEGLVPVLN